jgi:hypothetical protein
MSDAENLKKETIPIPNRRNSGIQEIGSWGDLCRVRVCVPLHTVSLL